jgi:hypothetical protein
VVHAIAAQKAMLTVLLSINRAIFINWFSPGETFNNGYFCQKMLEPLSQILHSRRAACSARPIQHSDNAAPQRPAVTESCFESCQFRHAPQPTYSPDIRTCDRFLFGDLEKNLKGEEFDTMEELEG